MKKPCLAFLTLSAAFFLLTGTGLGQGIMRLKDINTQAPSGSAFPGSVAVVNGTFFIAADHNLIGGELWKSDGTVAGTVLVKDIIPGNEGSEPKLLTAVGAGAAARLFFVTKDNKLWISDGTAAGTSLVQDKVALPASQALDTAAKLCAVGSTLFFEGRNGTHGRELWRADLNGKAEMVKDIREGGSNSNANLANMVNSNGVLFFSASDGSATKIWRSNGTLAGTVAVTDAVEQPAFLTPFTSFLLFSATDPLIGGVGRELWKTNGTSGQEIYWDAEPNGSSDPAFLTPAGNNVYFSAVVSPNPKRLFLTDGLSVNVGPLTNTSGSPYENPENITAITVGAGQQVVFSATDATNGTELWRSNGTNSGTTLVSNIATGSESSDPSNFVKLGPSTVLFTAKNASGVLGLWKVEGSTGSIVASKLVDLPEGPAATPASFQSPVLVSGTGGAKIYFILNNSEFWVTDGTTAGTLKIKGFRSGDATSFTADSDPADFTPHGLTEAYFSADDGLTGRELWKTDGTEDGTVRVSDIFAGALGSDPKYLVSGGDHVYFSAAGDGADRELWRTDGTDTELVRDIRPSVSSDPQHLFWSETHDLLFFSAHDGTNGRELWRSDGTVNGTFMVKRMVEFGDSITANIPPSFVLFGDRVYYTANVDGIGTELLSTTGTLNDIETINLAPGGLSSSPAGLVVLERSETQQILFFAATVGSTGRELWKMDEAGNTARVKDINPGSGHSDPRHLTPVDKVLFFVAQTATSGSAANAELWKSDGTENGTVMVKDIAPGTASSSPEQLVEVGGRLFFVANDGTNGAELWVSNGTPAGTVMVKNIVAGSGSPDIQELRNVNGVAVFTADDGVNGREVWISDGTSVGTFIVRDLTNDGASSSPQYLTNFNGRLLYSGATYGSGQEPRMGALDAEIVVEHPANNPLTTGAEVDAGNVSLVNYRDLQFVIRNDGLNSLKGIAATITGPEAKEFTLVAKPPAILGQEGVVVLTVKFAPKALGLRTAKLTITSNDLDEGVIEINLRGTGTDVFTQQPSPLNQLVVVGDSATFNVGVNADGGQPPAIQWRQGTKAILGATEEELILDPVTLNHAGSYNVQVKSGKVAAVSSSVNLSVVDNTERTLVIAAGATATFKVTTKGTGLTYKWRRKFGDNPAEDLPNDPLRFKNSGTATLQVLKTEAPGDSATYFCEVTGPGATGEETVVGGTTVLHVFSDAPEIIVDGPLAFNPPNGIVSGTYNYAIPVNPDSAKAATSYTAKGLPTGVKIDTKTGVIAGKPTKAGFYTITVIVGNARGKDTATATIEVFDFPEDLAGAYTGIVERSQALNAYMGGRVDLVISSTGSFTGSLVLGATKYPLKGAVDVDVAGNDNPSITLTIPRKGFPDPLVFYVEIAANTFVGDSQVNDGTAIAGIDGWRLVWSKVMNPAYQYQGAYTLGIRPPSDGPEARPEGWGFGSFAVAVDGKLKLAGKTADGETITLAVFVGPNGQLPIFQPLYKTNPKGSLLGPLTIGLSGNTADPDDNTISGSLSWVRPEDGNAKARTYKGGFGLTGLPVEVDVVGGFFAPVKGDTMIMGVTPGFDNVEVVFDPDEEALADAALDPSSFFSLGNKNKVQVPPAAQNPAALKFSLAAAKGTFTGSVTLEDANPRTIEPIGPSPVKRIIKFQGMVINDGMDSYGVGYYLNPRLPGDEPLTTITTSDILSGSVIFREREN